MSERDYLNLLERVCSEGEQLPNQFGIGSLSLFGERIEFDLEEGFPLLTTCRTNFKAIAEELAWFISGSTNVDTLGEQGAKHWAQYADSQGNVGPIYGEQWRNWGFENTHETVDQLRDVAWKVVNGQTSHCRLVMTAWNPSYLPDTSLAPCSNPPLGDMAIEPNHCLLQFYVREGRYLDCQLYTTVVNVCEELPRSLPMFALLTHILAHLGDLHPGKLINVIGEAVICEDQRREVDKRLAIQPSPLPALKVDRSLDTLEDFTYAYIQVINSQQGDTYID